MTSSPAVADATRRRDVIAWSLWDWGSAAFNAVIVTFVFSVYLTDGVGDDLPGPVSASSWLGWSVGAASLVIAVLAPVMGQRSDAAGHRKRSLALLTTSVVAVTALMFLVEESYEFLWLGLLLIAVGTVLFELAQVPYFSMLRQVSTPETVGRVSGLGWAFGYLGGGLLLAANLALVTGHDALGVSTGTAVRISLATAGLWWAAFTVIPYLRLVDRPPRGGVPRTGSVVRGGFGQLFTTLRDARAYPMTLLFLVAYLFYNDGIQTVIGVASVYGDKQLGFETGVLIATILLVQFVAFGGALLFGRVAARVGSRTAIIAGLCVWVAVGCVGFFLPAGELVPFLALAAAIGIVLGGTQALSRSFFSQLIPAGREAEYFSLYQAGERGTSWLGTLVFGLVQQWTDSYRPAIAALAVFFLVGLVLLLRVDARRAIREAGNQPPAVV